MRVALDGTYSRIASGGIPRYARALTTELQRMPGVEVVELGGGSFAPRRSVRRIATTAALQLVWYPWLARRKAAGAGADVFHCLLPRGPLGRGRPPTVVTLHDLVPYHFPESMTRWGHFYARATHRSVLMAADRIIVPSSSTAEDATRLLSIPAARIRVVPMGIDAEFFGAAVPDGRAEPYILFVGCPNPRKNLERLEDAVAALHRRGFSHSLLIAGEDTWGRVSIRQPFTRVLGRVTDEELRDLYANAACLALPSLHEGFGLPALEAMAAGTPVVASTAGSLPEVAGDAALLVDPYDTSAIAEALAQAITDGAELRERGRRRAAEFSWERTARETVTVYREIA